MLTRTLLFALLISAVTTLPAAAKEIEYKVTSRMWEDDSGRTAFTSEEVLEKIHSAFERWQQASFGSLSFKFGGLTRTSYDSRAQLPFDGAIHIVLNGRYNFHGESANADFHGEIPGDYKRGAIFVSPTAMPLTQHVLVHEIGHALGLEHSASTASVMFSGAWSGGSTVHHIPETDSASLRALWAPESPGLYTLSGKTETQHTHAMAFVFAVNAENGRTFSTRADNLGQFTLAISAPGEYYLVAKSVEASQDTYPSYRKMHIPHSASWYARDGISVAHHARARLFRLDPLNPSVTDLRLRMLDQPASFPLTWATIQSRSHQKAFIPPGDSAIIRFPQIPGLANVEPFGSEPDYRFELITSGENYVSGAILATNPDADPGERLIRVTTSYSSNIGLIGVYILPPERDQP